MNKKCIPCGTPPTPYYKEGTASVTQNHSSVFKDTQYAAGVRIIEQFVVPALGTDISINAPNLTDIVVGSYLWSPAYGYLKIVHWDSCTKTLGLLNEDMQGGAIPGTVVSENSLFAVTARPCCADQDNFALFPFLAEDYEIPPVNDPVTLAVTSTYGLIQGTNVRIGSSIYYLDQINSSLEIIVINQGAGGTPGSTVSARDVNGDLQYLITQAVNSACTVPGTDSGKLIICDNADQKVLEGDYVGQVPVLKDTVTQEVEFELLDTSVRTCTLLTAPLNVLAATPSYTIDVADESIFSIGEIIQINFGALRWEITDNTTPNELDITCTTGNPGSTFVVPTGSTVCLQLCCESTTERIEELETDVAQLQSDVQDIETILDDGWLPVSNSGTYISSFSFSITGNVTNLLKIGQKLKLLLNGTPVYGNIKTFTFGGGLTTIVLISNSDFALTNNPITFVEVSHENPPDFPAYFNYTPVATIGFDATPSVTGIFWVIDSIVTGKIYASGVSNSTGFRVTLPTPFQNLGYPVGSASRMIDNGTSLDTIGVVTTAGTQEVNVATSGEILNPWTNSGNKEAFIDYSYIMDQ